MPTYHDKFTQYASYLLQTTSNRMAHKVELDRDCGFDRNVQDLLNFISNRLYEKFKDFVQDKIEQGYIEPQYWRDLYEHEQFRKPLEQLHLIAAWSVALFNLNELPRINESLAERGKQSLFACFEIESERVRILKDFEALATTLDDKKIPLTEGLSPEQILDILEGSQPVSDIDPDLIDRNTSSFRM